jgi:hypothetical protein
LTALTAPLVITTFTVQNRRVDVAVPKPVELAEPYTSLPTREACPVVFTSAVAIVEVYPTRSPRLTPPAPARRFLLYPRPRQPPRRRNVVLDSLRRPSYGPGRLAGARSVLQAVECGPIAANARLLVPISESRPYLFGAFLFGVVDRY